MKKMTVVVLGIVLFVVSIIAIWIVSRVIVPPKQTLFIATRDVQQGEMLEPSMVQAVDVQIPNPDQYLQYEDIEQYGYSIVVKTIKSGQFIALSDLAFADNPAAVSQSSLALSDPNMVIMVVPVTAKTSPPDVQPGDKVNLTLSVGAATFLTGELEAQPTAGAYAQFSGGSAGGGIVPFATLVPTATQPPSYKLPISKTVVFGAPVLKVLYDTTIGQTEATVGDIKAVVVSIPAETQEILAYAIDNGTVRVAIASPLAKDGEGDITAGMSWDDLVAYFKWQRILWLLQTDDTLDISAPGAAPVYQTLVATMFPSPTPLPTNTPTPTPEGMDLTLTPTGELPTLQP